MHVLRLGTCVAPFACALLLCACVQVGTAPVLDPESVAAARLAPWEAAARDVERCLVEGDLDGAHALLDNLPPTAPRVPEPRSRPVLGRLGELAAELEMLREFSELDLSIRGVWKIEGDEVRFESIPRG